MEQHKEEILSCRKVISRITLHHFTIKLDLCWFQKHAKNVSSCKGCLLEMYFYERWLSLFRHNMTFLP